MFPQDTISPFSEPTKRCLKCGEIKPRSQFDGDRTRSDGLYPSCKTCQKERNRRYRAEKREEIEARRRARRLADPDQTRQRSRAYYAAHAEHMREKRRNYYATNTEKVRQTNRDWRIRNREAVLVSNRRHHATYPERHRASHLVNSAIRAGRLPRVDTQFCFVCGTSADQGATMEYHHVDYDKPFDIFPVCISCHRRWHFAMK